MKSFRLYKPECPEYGSKNCGVFHSIANRSVLLIFHNALPVKKFVNMSTLFSRTDLTD